MINLLKRYWQKSRDFAMCLVLSLAIWGVVEWVAPKSDYKNQYKQVFVWGADTVTLSDGNVDLTKNHTPVHGHNDTVNKIFYHDFKGKWVPDTTDKYKGENITAEYSPENMDTIYIKRNDPGQAIDPDDSRLHMWDKKVYQVSISSSMITIYKFKR